ncbi:hypothetical protein ACP3T3_06725 [Chryseobacterium sp. CBSDS_008]|uniref:hypothetical protein n=1 Tax=Chryseobacterium sp. CBSDS_008 TaxID=3415265 RepID=UPI003CEB6908
MNPKGKLVIGRSIEKGSGIETIEKAMIHDFPDEIFTLLLQQKDARIEFLTASDPAQNIKEKYFTAFQKKGYCNFGFIHIDQKQDVDNYYSRIFDAKIVLLAEEEPQFYEVLKNSLLMKLLHKKYLEDEDFTIVGINAGAMYIPRFFLNETGIAGGFGFISNCIIDTKFNHGTRFKNMVNAIISHPECLGIGLNRGMALLIEKGYKASCFGGGSVMVVNAKNVKKNRLRSGASVYTKNLKGHILTQGSILNLFNGNLIRNHLFDCNLNFTSRNTIQ